METKNLIPIEQFCSFYKIETTFIDSLESFGLVEVIVVDNNPYFPEDQLAAVERMRRLHYELAINLEGVDAINFLLQRIEHLNQELMYVKNRLGLFE